MSIVIRQVLQDFAVAPGGVDIVDTFQSDLQPGEDNRSTQGLLIMIVLLINY